MQEELACEETLRRAMVGSGNESVPSKSRPSARKLREAYENLSPKPMWFYLQVLSTGIDKNLQESQAKKRKATETLLNRQVGQIISILDHLLILRLFTLHFIAAFDWFA